MRSQRLLPGQLGDRERPGRPRVRGSGYERGGSGLGRTRTHALRHSVRPEGYRRETVCGALAVPMEGQHFLPLAANACQTCATVVALAPLAAPIQPSNELSLLRALIEETREQRLAPDAAVAWLQQHGPPRPAARPAA